MAPSARAHRLNEYLQATTLELAPNHLTLHLRLTPGTDVAAQVLAGLDANHDGIFSPTEQHAYAARVQHDLALTLDGRPTPLHLIEAAFPPPRQLTAGLGDIGLTFEAPVPASRTPHHLTLLNQHQPALAAYLVNCLLPRQPGLRVLRQARSFTQARYELTFATASAAPAGTDGNLSLHRADQLAVMRAYFGHGLGHILTGYDHLLFLAALVLGAASLWELVKVISAFTLAHALTLTLAAYQLVQVPEALVEILIAGSIVAVALQNIFWPSAASRGSRLAVAFGFGLVHGLGFASGLLTLLHQLPHEVLLLALLGFSLGLEAGQQLVMLPVFGLRQVLSLPMRSASQPAISFTGLLRLGSMVIAGAGVFYFCRAVAAMV
ncbi:HupE/UreJ family protein [Hymenobacter convexus]|uniref:HupE/UreJ family protein n=1 Tax=Hymenobacter sp. CA1UV-4 TaxID=3063782 RepID=UPI002712D999|nr:HupE/UreJ family protein [Hymenobacter sp. CA1UV-4]MDO7854075.1 HupE/UreJ family protein [Hymenobacter sp. CA1UV-4]